MTCPDAAPGDIVSVRTLAEYVWDDRGAARIARVSSGELLLVIGRSSKPNGEVLMVLTQTGAVGWLAEERAMLRFMVTCDV